MKPQAVRHMAQVNTFIELELNNCMMAVLRKPRRRFEDNIKMDFKKQDEGDVDWIYVAKNKEEWRAHNTEICLLFP